MTTTIFGSTILSDSAKHSNYYYLGSFSVSGWVGGGIRYMPISHFSTDFELGLVPFEGGGGLANLSLNYHFNNNSGFITGITYSKNKREKIGDIFNENNTILVEDNPYGEIRFIGEDLQSIKNYIENTVLLGSFSKIVSPGMRLGWIVADKEIMNHLITAKQASDLHSNYLTQMIVHRYLTGYDVENHIQNIRDMYRIQRDCMVNMIKKYFPSDVKYTKPEGGMFLWVTLPEDMSSMELFEIAIKENVAFVPGEAFYSNNPETNTLRLNFSNSNKKKIEEGIKRLGHAIKYLKQI